MERSDSEKKSSERLRTARSKGNIELVRNVFSKQSKFDMKLY